MELKIKNYTNLLDSLKFDASDVEKVVKNYTLHFPQQRNKTVEWEMKFPMFVTSFYKYIKDYNTIPTQKNFWGFYKKKNANFFEKNKLSDEIVLGLRARIYRTYPSLVRDLHFCLLLRDNMPNSEVIYNKDLDIIGGLDVVIQNNSRLFGVNLYTQTSRAKLARTKKENRHTKYNNIINVELPVDFKGSNKCGNFFLYGKRELDDLIKQLNKVSNLE